MNDLDLLRAWNPAPAAAPPEVREHARARLGAAYDGRPTERPTPVRRQFAKRLAVAAVVMTVLVAGAIVWVQRQADDRFSKLETVAVPNDSLGGGQVGHGPLNILVVGSDLRDGSDPEAFGTPAETGPKKSDTMFLLRIDGTNVSGLWLPRDLITSTGVLLNSTFNNGPQSLIDAIRTEFGVTVDHYVQVNFRSFPKVVDKVGGVKLFFPGPVRDAFSGLNITAAGCQTLDGRTALSWVRSRHTELMENGVWNDVLSGRADLDRLLHQQEFIRALARQMAAYVDGDPVKAVRLVDALIPGLVVDSEFSRAEILGLVRTLMDVDPASMQLGTVPVEASLDGAHLVLLKPAADQALAPFTSTTPVAPRPQPAVPATAVVHDC